MWGTNPTAFRAYSKYKACSRMLDLFGCPDASEPRFSVGLGHAVHESAVNTRASPPRPIQVSNRPQRISSGTRVPEAAMPRPTPVKITPPATPRRPGGIAAITVGAARAMSTPPVPPETKRQTKNQPKLRGNAQANRLIAVSSIADRKVVFAPRRAATNRAPSAPAKYPARLAAPKNAAAEGANQPAAMIAGSSGV